MKNADEFCQENESHVLATMITCGFHEAWERATVDCGLKVDDFRFNKSRAVFETMQALASESHDPLNYLAIRDRCPKIAVDYIDSDLTGGRWEGFNTFAALASYIRFMREANQRLLVSDVIEEHGTANPRLVSQKIEEALIAQISGSTLTADHAADFSQIFSELELLSESKEGLVGISSGYPSLNRCIFGFRPGELYIIAARPAMGKSAFVANLALNMLADGKGVYIQALEEMKKGVLKRMLSNISGVTMDSLMSGKFEGEDADKWPEVTAAMNKFSKFNLVIDDQSGLTGGAIAQRIKQAAKRFKLDVVFIDHLQEIFGDAKENRHQQISRALQELKVVAKELKIPMIVLSQINRGTESRENKFPTMSDLKESGDIEAKADCVMLLFRKDYYENQKPQESRDAPDNGMIVSIAKNRNGKTGAVKLLFDGSRMRITEYPNEYKGNYGASSNQGHQRGNHRASPNYRNPTNDD